MKQLVLQAKRRLSVMEEQQYSPSRILDHPAELFLGPSSSSESEANVGRKRKLANLEEPPSSQASIDLQPYHPLPLDWEQCLDLQSGRMYYLNRKTLKKSTVRPKDHKLDLDLNISSLPSDGSKKKLSRLSAASDNTLTTGGSMAAIICLNCHLLVMLSWSSPTCPNCKYMHSLPPAPMIMPSPRKMEAVKPIETLSLLH
ncbi:hypothetical protein AXF42_Ash003326 [Apostasia shenzhenica]|uniref:WW domain-containing protein n=1 Tax=Apostasia shenzhenica TaxID=1088818 RepID=A0A2I0BFV6_9ASPA|nr:hypothetical protein AXF42_Ash003326 [Apostasia shenzhenica]